MADDKILFGTPKPFPLKGPVAGETYEARTSGTAYVSKYDTARYPTQEELVIAIRTNASRIIESGLSDWTVEEAVKVDSKTKITAMLTEGFAPLGIKASFILNNVQLTQESEVKYKKTHGDTFGAFSGWLSDRLEGQPKLEDLVPETHGPVVSIYSSYSSSGMSIGSEESGSETVTWQPDGTLLIESVDRGRGVEIREKNIGGAEAARKLREYIASSRVAEMAQVKTIPSPYTMTDYSSSSHIRFTFDDSSVGGASNVERSLDCGSFWEVQRQTVSRIRELIKECVDTGKCIGHTKSTYNQRAPFGGFMGMGMGMGMGIGTDPVAAPASGAPEPASPEPAPKTTLPDSPDKWICSCCGAENLGKFCSECGTPKPKKKEIQCECGYVSSGKFCPNCGKRLEPKQAEQDAGTYTLNDHSGGKGSPANNQGLKIVATQYGFRLVTEEEAAAIEEKKKNEKPAGWTCEKCGAELQTGDNCEKCGEKIKKVILFSFSSYASTNPPRYEGGAVYEFSDTMLIYETYYNNDTKYRFISAQVIEPAYEIIKKYGIDKWKDHVDNLCGMMGGRESVGYRDGDDFVGSSTDHMGSAVQSACSALRALFNNAVI